MGQTTVAEGSDVRDGNSRTPGGPTDPSLENIGHSVTDSRTGGLPGDHREHTEDEPGSVHVIVEGARTRIVLSGEIDADLGPDLLEATADAEATGLPIDVDTQHVTFMDSSGIAFLARIATRSTDRVRVLRAPEGVRFLLDVTRIGELLDVVDAEHPEETPRGEKELGEGEPGADHGLPTIGPAGRGRPAAVPPGPEDVA